MAPRDVIVISSDSPSPPPHSPPPLAAQPNLIDYLEADLDAALNGDLNHNLDGSNLQGLPEPSLQMPAVLRSSLGAAAQNEGMSKCEEDVLSCFPDICPGYLKTQVQQHHWNSQSIVTRLLDDLEKGEPYPKRVSLKQKRPERVEEKEKEEVKRRKFNHEDPRLVDKEPTYQKLYIKKAKALLKVAFHQRYAEDIESALKANNYQLYATYLLLDKASWSAEGNAMKHKRISSKRPHAEEDLRRGVVHQAEIDALAAFDAARAFCTEEAEARESKEAEQRQKVQEEEENFRRAKAEGSVAECGCCYEELALNSMVHCAGDTTHWFCRSCAKQMAEHLVGLSKYRLGCMSVDGCDATFSRDQKELFLDDKLTNALEQIEQEEVLRLAGIENLESCPFCPYAAEYPPVEENKEFRCENPECNLVSCRLCRQETHIPKTCEEIAKERGHSARRTIEEAMSAALIRKCNKCGTPFIKEHGCNKMTCTRGGCGNVQCYVCSKRCDYDHFDDIGRGGKKGNCPLYDSVEVRHQNEVHAAEARARQQVVEQNPDVGEELLDINFSEKVKEDDVRRGGARPTPQRAHQRQNLGVVVPGRLPVVSANRVLPPAAYIDARPRIRQLAEFEQQLQKLKAQADARGRILIQTPPAAPAQPPHARQEPVGRVDHPQVFQYPPYNLIDFTPLAQTPGVPTPRSAPPATAAPAAPATPAVSVAPAARVDSAGLAAPVTPTARVASAAPGFPGQPYVNGGLGFLRHNALVAGARDAGVGQTVIQPGGTVRKCNLSADPRNNLSANYLNHDPFADPYNKPLINADAKNPFGIYLGSPWRPDAAIQARGQAPQPGHRPNPQQGAGANHGTGARGSQFREGVAAENANLAAPNIEGFPGLNMRGFPTPIERDSVVPEIQDPPLLIIPRGERRQ